MYCYDHHSKKVQWKTSGDTRKAISYGYEPDGTPVIKYNPDILNIVDPLLRKFAVYHVCSHLVLGHLIKTPSNFNELYQQEIQADCWAAGKLHITEGAGLQQIEKIQNLINAMPRKDWKNFPGLVRVVEFKKTCHLN